MAQRRDGNLLLHGLVPRSRPTRLLALLATRLGAGRFPVIRLMKRNLAGRHYRGLEMSRGAALTLVRPFRWGPFRSLPPRTGWLAASVSGAAVAVDVVASRHGTSGKFAPAATHTTHISSDPIELSLPDLSHVSDQLSDLDLTVTVKGRGPVFLAVHEILQRSEILRVCRGRGVEIGPGLNPQIRPSADVDVMYVEQATPEQWETLYNPKGKLTVDRSLWTRYVQGNAYPLPVADNSLDFIFSSHVFEHLANPIGHLAHWHSKLRQGGVIAAVVPDYAGCKDYVFEPTTMKEIDMEFTAAAMEPNNHHFARWAAVRAPGQDPARFMALNRSIHVHFYSRDNMSALLQYACEKVGFTRFKLHHVPNHKDFYFALWK